MAISVRYGYDDQLVLADGTQIWVSDFGDFGASLEALGQASLPRLRRALATHARAWDEPEATLWLSDDAADRFDVETSSPLPYRLVCRDADLLLEVDLWSKDRLPDDSELFAGMASLLERWRADVVDAEDRDVDYGYARSLAFRMPIARRTVNEAVALGEEILNLADVIIRGGLGPSIARELLEAGLWRLFLDMYEANWLEVKSQHYGRTTSDELSFANDVASFCNAAGGLLIIGMKTRRLPEGDRIAVINECPLPRAIVRRYEQLLRRYPYPAPRGLRIQALRRRPQDEAGLLLVEIPDQPELLRPFLVRGAFTARRVQAPMSGSLRDREPTPTGWHRRRCMP
jgi:hypothetical protein